ncbi:hypothetical protein Lal_00031603 [Lupinus albus]|nr:hypothetical protein Lal_00031603 [Lupinus albus]
MGGSVSMPITGLCSSGEDLHSTKSHVETGRGCAFGRRKKLDSNQNNIVVKIEGNNADNFPNLYLKPNPTDAQTSSANFEEFSVSVADINDVRELKISIEVSGNKTQKIFDDVFEKMVAAAQPIPGFRRVKGGGRQNIRNNVFGAAISGHECMTFTIKRQIGAPNRNAPWALEPMGVVEFIPKDILLEVLGPFNVYRKVIKQIINSTIGEYVEKVRLVVSNDLRVEQSFEDLEASFEAGEKFSFDAVIQLENSKRKRSSSLSCLIFSRSCTQLSLSLAMLRVETIHHNHVETVGSFLPSGTKIGALIPVIDTVFIQGNLKCCRRHGYKRSVINTISVTKPVEIWYNCCILLVLGLVYMLNRLARTGFYNADKKKDS